MEPTQGGTSSEEARGWSALHEDILGMVLARLGSPRDHALFAAVCPSWRVLVSMRPHPRIHPWLLLDPHEGGETKRVHCPGDGVVLPLVTRRLIERCSFVGCHPGGWVAYEAPLRVTNVFSGAEVALPEDHRRSFVTRKVIFSKSPASSGCILAAITDKHDEVVICGLDSPECGWATRRFDGHSVVDITFCNGHLYLVGTNKEIAKLEVGLDKSGKPAFGAVHWLTIHNQHILQNYFVGRESDPDADAVYIFELRGELAMAVRRSSLSWLYQLSSTHTRVPYFVVLQLVDLDMDEATSQHSYNWVVVFRLGNHVLFLGPTCSKALHVSTGERGGGPRKNHIYYSHHTCYKHKNSLPDSAKEFLTSSSNDGCRVHYKEDESADDRAGKITSVGYYVCGGGHPPMWLFPPDV